MSIVTGAIQVIFAKYSRFLFRELKLIVKTYFMTGLVMI